MKSKTKVFSVVSIVIMCLSIISIVVTVAIKPKAKEKSVEESIDVVEVFKISSSFASIQNLDFNTQVRGKITNNSNKDIESLQITITAQSTALVPLQTPIQKEFATEIFNLPAGESYYVNINEITNNSFSKIIKISVASDEGDFELSNSITTHTSFSWKTPVYFVCGALIVLSVCLFLYGAVKSEARVNGGSDPEMLEVYDQQQEIQNLKNEINNLKEKQSFSYCPYCGVKNSAEADHCKHCGAKINQ